MPQIETVQGLRVVEMISVDGCDEPLPLIESRAYILRRMADRSPICGDTGDTLVFMTKAEARNHRDVTFGDLAADHIEVVRVE
jgi:hypothetical protein